VFIFYHKNRQISLNWLGVTFGEYKQTNCFDVDSIIFKTSYTVIFRKAFFFSAPQQQAGNWFKMATDWTSGLSPSPPPPPPKGPYGE